jgi:hypothetical protein
MSRRDGMFACGVSFPCCFAAGCNGSPWLDKLKYCSLYCSLCTAFSSICYNDQHDYYQELHLLLPQN